MERIKMLALHYVEEYGYDVLMAIVTLIVGIWLINFVTRRLKNFLLKKEVDEGVASFSVSFTNIILKVLLLFSIAGMFGVKTAAFIAVFGAIAFAIGMALQGSLAHFASGVLIVLFKPYKVGDFVTLDGKSGEVTDIGIFNTTIVSLDNKEIILPNSLVTSHPIENLTSLGTRRVDMTFGISYQSDIDKARSVIQKVADRETKILKDPGTDIFIENLNDSSVDFAVRPWCESAHYWDVYFYMHEEIKKAFDKEGISIPYPQVDVHMQK